MDTAVSPVNQDRYGSAHERLAVAHPIKTGTVSAVSVALADVPGVQLSTAVPAHKARTGMVLSVFLATLDPTGTDSAASFVAVDLSGILPTASVNAPLDSNGMVKPALLLAPLAWSTLMESALVLRELTL
jgi:hypothetical protein